MKEFLSRSETDFSIHSRHTLTKEAAQEELLICLGLTLKDKLQDHWKARKSEEIIRLMFYNIVKTFKKIIFSCKILYRLLIALSIILTIYTPGK